MTEKPCQGSYQKNERLGGRFLFLVDNYRIQSNPFDYARSFADEYSDIINARRDTSSVSREQILDKNVELEFTKYNTNTFAWRIIVAGERFSNDHISQGTLPAGGEQYELICSQENIRAYYYLMNIQRSIVRKEPITEPRYLDAIQGVVEFMTQTCGFYKNVAHIRGDTTRTYAAIAHITQKVPKNFNDEKNLRSLKSHLFQAGFPVGSPPIGKKEPLLSDCSTN